MGSGLLEATIEKDRRVLVSDGASIAYSVVNPEGAAMPVVLVPGLFCTDTYVAPLIPNLVEGDHPVIVLDNRGHFDSTLPRKPTWGTRNISDEEISMARAGRDVIEVLDDAGVSRAVIAGHSLGVQILFEAYRAGGPERVAGLVPIAGTYENPISTFMRRDLNLPYVAFDRIRPFIPFRLLRPILRLAFAPNSPLARKGPDVAVSFIRAIGAGGDGVTPDVVRPHVERISEFDFEVGFRFTRSMWRHSAADVLKRLRSPVLVLSGANDRFTPPEIQARMAELAPIAELVTFPDGTHFLPVDEPVGCGRAIRDFIARRVV